MCQALYVWGKRGSESLNKLLKVTHQISSGAGIWTKICTVAKPFFSPSMACRTTSKESVAPQNVMRHCLRSFLWSELLLLLLTHLVISYDHCLLPTEFLLPPCCRLTSGKKRAIIWINRSGYYMSSFSFCLINCYLCSIEILWPFKNKL